MAGRFRREHINDRDGPLKITIELQEHDRFLSLVATDGGNGYFTDRVLFGDPRLVLAEYVSVPEKRNENTLQKAMRQ